MADKVKDPKAGQDTPPGGQNSPPSVSDKDVATGRSKTELERDAGQPLKNDDDAVTRTAGEYARDTLDANVGPGAPVNPGVPDAALGQHAPYENQVQPPDADPEVLAKAREEGSV